MKFRWEQTDDWPVMIDPRDDPTFPIGVVIWKASVGTEMKWPEILIFSNINDDPVMILSVMMVMMRVTMTNDV